MTGASRDIIVEDAHHRTDGEPPPEPPAEPAPAASSEAPPAAPAASLPAASAVAGPVGEVGPDLAGRETIEQIRARLAARGLLRASSTPVPQPVLPSARPRRATFSSDFEQATNAALEGEVDELDFAPAATPTTLGAAACPACGTSYGVPGDRTGFRCRSCERAWRWGICQSCDQMSLTPEKQDSWRCPLCGHFTRSWWRAPEPAAHKSSVVDRRKRALNRLEEEHRKALRRKNRRLYLVAAALVAVLAGIGGVALVRKPPSAGDVAASICSSYGRLKSDIVNGTASHDDVSARLADMERRAKDAPGNLHGAVSALAAAGPPGTAAFLVAQADVSAACEKH